MRVYIHTWGCQLNEHKSEAIAGVLQQAGYHLVGSPREADIVIFNTCTVREKAVEKVLGKIGEIKRLRLEGRRVLLGIGGCLPQAEKERERLLERTDQVDFLFGTSDADIERLPEVIAKAQARAQGQGQSQREQGRGWGRGPGQPLPLVAVGPPAGLNQLPYRRASNLTAYVTITEGCDHFCSFCIVPYTRGRLRSRPPEEIVREVEELVEAGYKEVVLLGQNVNAYGVDLWGEGRFAQLLRQVAATGVPRIRFTASHPQDMTREVLEAIAELPNVCEQIHMAAQSGSDRVLRDMRRPYTKAEFLAKVEEARRLIPDVNITTDLIVGYPTETEEDFQETVDLVERARFGSAFIFIFSPRPGTVAAVKYGDPIPQEVKRRRHQELLELQRRISEEESRKLIGRTVEVLVEGRSEGRWFGRGRDHRMVAFHAPEPEPGSDSAHLIGKLVQVKVKGVAGGTLIGELLAEKVALSR